MPNLFCAPVLSRRRVWAVLLVAMAADIIQVMLGPLGWIFIDQALDLAVMGLTTALIGFHPLLLPTFVLELMPVADMLPTWTASVALVLALRRKQAVAGARPLSVPPRLVEVRPPRVIDV